MAMRCWSVFRAEHAYISPNWYPSKHDTHLLVPTWNYRVVHVHGRVRVHTDQRFLLRVLGSSRARRSTASTNRCPTLPGLGAPAACRTMP